MKQMTLFPKPIPPAPPSPVQKPQPQATMVVETDTALACKCDESGTHLLGNEVMCEECLLKALRGRRLLNKTAKQPVIIHCADGFRRVQRGQVQDFQPRGPRERVQPCAECKRLSPVHQGHTGEPALCPECSYAAFEELYPDGIEGG